MFEAYKVGITIALTNHISKGLGLVIRDLAKTDAQAIRLKKTLHSMEKLALGGAITGGIGYAMLKPLKAGYEAAKEYEQVFGQFKALNLGDAINADANKFARGSQVMGASATDLMGTMRDLHTALGDYGMAKSLTSQVSQMKWANQAIFGGHGMDFSERQLQAMEKIIEMKGGFHGPQQFMAQADMMQKVISGTGGMVKPSDYLQFIKTAGVSGRLLSNESFYYQMEPLIQELSGGRVGTGTMSAYNNLAQGRSTVRAATEMMRIGILNKNDVEYTKIGTIKRIKPGGLKGMDEFTSNPYGWMKDVLVPAMAKKGITGDTAIMNEMGAIFGNRTGSNLFSLMYLQQEKIAKNMEISKKAMGVEELVKLAKTNPEGAEIAMGKAWKNLNIAAGEVLIPIVIPAIVKFTDSLRTLGVWIDHHPIRFKWLIYGFTALGAAMAISGALMLLRAGFIGLRMALGLGGGSGLLRVIGTFGGLLSTALRGLMGLFIASGPIGWIILGITAVVAGGYYIYKHWDTIKPKLLAVWAGIKSWMSHIVEWFTGIYDKVAGMFQGGSPGGATFSIVPPKGNGNGTITVKNYMDGRQIGTGVAHVFNKEASRPAASSQMFDTGMMPAQTGGMTKIW